MRGYAHILQDKAVGHHAYKKNNLNRFGDCIRRVTDKTFDDFAGGKGDTKGARAILGLE